jgi:hypothetical protein
VDFTQLHKGVHSKAMERGGFGMYTNIYVDEPIEKIHEDWDFLTDKVIKKLQGFLPVGDNVYGIRQVVHAKREEIGNAHLAMELVKERKNFEIGPKGIVQVPRTPYVAHITCAGTPHHTQFVFGYWHINDKDEVIIPVPGVNGDLDHIVIIMGRPTGEETDRAAWYCEECTSLLHMSEYVTGREGFRGFWRWELAAVREYNADIRLRTCWHCGHVNPLAYSGFMSTDTPETREARKQW